mgnify:CR=1 FL=1
MKKALSLLLLLTSIWLTTNACINHYVINEKGQTGIFSFENPMHFNSDSAHLIKQLQLAQERMNKAPDDKKHEAISDYCAYLLKSGRHKEALPMLENLQRLHPKEYSINANLAVAYELDGQLEKALSFLKYSLRLDPYSHQRSEWVHEQILIAAILARQQPENFAQQSIFTLPKGATEEIAAQIAYQLQERVPLTPSPNPLLSKVLEETAQYFRQNVSLEWAIEYYAMAIGYSNDDVTKIRLWNQLTQAREKFVSLQNKKFKSSVGDHLKKANWKKQVEQIVARWERHKPIYYKGLL